MTRPSRWPFKLRSACAATLIAFARTTCAAAIPAFIVDAVDAPSRPAADRLRDAARRPDQVMAFAGIAPGAKVADFMPGTGYYSRILCTLVGESGHVYAISIASGAASTGEPLAPACANVTSIELRAAKRPAPELWSSSDDPGVVYEYWSFTPAAELFAAPEPLDAIWLAERYHELRSANLGSPNQRLVNRALWSALKSGGVLLIEDYVAERRSADHAAASVHRIDPEQVKRELVAAGFEFVGASKVLRRRDDPRTANAHASNDAADRFLLKFRKR